MKLTLFLIATSVNPVALRQKKALAVTQNAKIWPVLCFPLLYLFALAPWLAALFLLSPSECSGVPMLMRSYPRLGYC